MKKIHLSIPKPCHEDWNKMKPEEKGRFCASCQKTVIDFTQMSDRQMAEFFRKPGSSVCGRFLNGQLKTEIQIPKKRIPWAKYFFQITLPAFLLSLKSCGERTIGKANVTHTETVSETRQEIMVGQLELLEIDYKMTDPDTSFALDESPGERWAPKTVLHVEDEILGQLDITSDKNDTATLEYNFNDRPKHDSSPNEDLRQNKEEEKLNGMLGEVIITSAKPKTECIKPLPIITEYKTTNLADKEAVIYPNPVKAGQLLTIVFKNSENFPSQIQLISSSGQTLTSQLNNLNKYSSRFSLRIPEKVTSGTYFIQFIYSDNTIRTNKIIVMQ